MQFNYLLKPFGLFSLTLVAGLSLFGCSAVSVLAPINDEASNGLVRFYQSGNSLKIQVYLSNLSPLSTHNLRIYAVGDCRDPQKGSVGEPFDHTINNLQREAVKADQIGNLGDVTADEDGIVESYFLVLGSKLTGPREGSILGRSLILELKGENEISSRPIACGLISKNSTL